MILGSLFCVPSLSGGASVGKERQKYVQTAVQHILLLVVTYNRGRTLTEIYCAVAEKRRSRSGDAKS